MRTVLLPPTRPREPQFPLRARRPGPIRALVAQPRRSDAEIDLPDVIVMGEGIARAFARDAAMLQEVNARGDAERGKRVLLDQQDGRAPLLDLANGFEDLELEAVGDADRRLVEQQQRRAAHERAAD